MRRTDAPGFSQRPADWLHVAEAQRRILEGAHPLGGESLSLDQALGRALARPLVASATLPPWDNSAMDGYAVRGQDVDGATPSRPVALKVTAVVRAGGDAGAFVGSGEAIRIMTGAPLPSGADTVIRVEDTDGEAAEGTVQIFDDRDRGRHIRPAGQDMRAGTTLLEAGHSLTAGSLGVAIAAGAPSVHVHQVPSVAILPTGDELREPHRYDDVRKGLGVPESNGTTLSAMTAAIGAVPRHLGIAPDDPAELARRIESGSDADVLITIGGASMGEADFVKRVLDQAGFELDFWRVKMRPGSPVSFGWLTYGDRRQAVFGLPGNPSSAFVTFEVFVRPFLLRLAGHRRIFRRVMTCRAGGRMETPAELTYFQRVHLRRQGEDTVADLTGPQLSGLVSGLASADGLAVIPPETPAVDEGEPVEVMLLDTGPGALEGQPDALEARPATEEARPDAAAAETDRWEPGRR
ncbi:MAG: molybdopterin molybdotransferase MoeA [Longimicrobiales bacterium]|nr:molybdopterin molybdotransferase MoeA [Longimicrobiales bacterium]